MQILFNKYRTNDENDEQIEGELLGVFGMLRNEMIAGFVLEFEWQTLWTFLLTDENWKSDRKSFVVFDF